MIMIIKLLPSKSRVKQTSILIENFALIVIVCVFWEIANKNSSFLKWKSKSTTHKEGGSVTYQKPQVVRILFLLESCVSFLKEFENIRQCSIASTLVALLLCVRIFFRIIIRHLVSEINVLWDLQQVWLVLRPSTRIIINNNHSSLISRDTIKGLLMRGFLSGYDSISKISFTRINNTQYIPRVPLNQVLALYIFLYQKAVKQGHSGEAFDPSQACNFIFFFIIFFFFFFSSLLRHESLFLPLVLSNKLKNSCFINDAIVSVGVVRRRRKQLHFFWNRQTINLIWWEATTSEWIINRW